MRQNRIRFCAFLIIVLLLCVSAVWAQDEDVNTYLSGFTLMPLVIKTIMWSGAYLPIYAAALVIPLAYFQRFGGFDADMLLWIGLLWLGGMGANAVGYAVTSHQFLAALIAMPLIFGWTVLLSTRSWTDLCVKDAVKVGIIVALVCAPYFGKTWHIAKPKVEEVGVLSVPSACVILPACHTKHLI